MTAASPPSIDRAADRAGDRGRRLCAPPSSGTARRFAVRVAPDFAGTWEGRVRVTACTTPDDHRMSGLFARVRSSSRASRSSRTARRSSARSISRSRPVFRRFRSGSTDATLSGSIELAGRLPMTGVLVGPTPTSPSVGAIADWRTEIDTTQPILRGSYSEVITSTGSAATISWEFIGLTRVTS